MSDPDGYQVLARKYRPATFKDLIGQGAMVRTLKNAFEANRIAHAFIMTGVRGVGKTTTARIIAKGLNCIGPDGLGGPTIQPCGECEPCIAIAEGRHVDVFEMDAASRTGVGDIREIIDAVQYRAASARFKIYIIDEVHMLSTSAFNALLKTLEEPPEHVKFIFATTEIRKIPVTVLSRCQRFDLRRIEADEMIAFLDKIAKLENAEIQDAANMLIARASEGSVRDALSLLDQAIAHGAGVTNAKQVREMLGLSDRGRILDLFDMIMKGDVAAALSELAKQYADGADPVAVLKDLAEVTHWVSVVKLSPEIAEDPTVSPDERIRGLDLADKLSMRVLTRMWQMLIKAIEEARIAPNAMMSAEMTLIRLTHVSELPSPEELIKKLKSMPADEGASKAAVSPNSQGQEPSGNVSVNTERSQANKNQTTSKGSGGMAPTSQLAVATDVKSASETALERYAEFEDIIALIRQQKDVKMLIEVENYVRLASYEPGKIEIMLTGNAPQALTSNLSTRLHQWTGVRWAVIIVNEGGGDTIAEKRLEDKNNKMGEAMRHPIVAKVLELFPGAEIKSISTPEEIEAAAVLGSVEEDDLDDDWSPVDPFEEDR